MTRKLKEGELEPNYFEQAARSVVPNLRSWLLDPAIDELSPNLKPALEDAVQDGRWEELVNAFVREVEFGTGGIRALMAFDYDSIVRLQAEGLDARIIKGMNTINNIVVLKSAYGVARFLVKSGDYVAEASSPKVVVGYDSRVRGASFAKAVAELLLAQGITVYLFDEAVPYPEVTFAIPKINADAGVFISASHNDYRYNGFKMSAANGAQFPSDRRAEVIERIRGARPLDLRAVPLEAASPDTLARLHFLGGSHRLPEAEYYGRDADLVDMHTLHIDHIKSFLQRKEANGEMEGGADLKIVYAAFNGSGRRAVPRILRELGCRQVHSIRSLDPLNGLFPAFDHRAGLEQQPDPGDPRAAEIALAELARDRSEHTFISWNDADLLIGTDPDADRCGVVVKPPGDYAKLLEQQPSVRATPHHVLVPADDMWALVLWYRLQFEREKSGRIPDADKKFIALSHTTSDMVAMVARRNGLGVLKTWVGFGWLSNGVAAVWRGDKIPKINEGRPPRTRLPGEPSGECDLVFYDTTRMDEGRSFNVATLEQSNGFSILGGPPANPQRSLGDGGHVRDKDGTFAALLVTEIAAYAKRENTDIFSLLADHVYCDPEVGLFVNYYEPDPIDGEFPGLQGSSKKRRILESALALHKESDSGRLKIGGRIVTTAVTYPTGKYDDANNWPGFPDEGIRFCFGSEINHVTVRPSGTTNSLRFHVQLFAGVPARDTVWQTRLEFEQTARRIVDDLRDKLGAPRADGARI
ncbi:MAG: hypothetical protein M3O61_11320 [Gemmatimonadota bacterium]|nr:hypothetical protein [Gemmatimonadota bacterium]